MKKNIRTLSSVMALVMFFTISLTTITSAKTVNNQEKPTYRLCRMVSSGPGEIPVVD